MRIDILRAPGLASPVLILTTSILAIRFDHTLFPSYIDKGGS